MKGYANRYSWADYYADAYEEQRKHSIALAAQIADAERKQADLNFKLNRIYSSIFWRVYAHFFKPFRDAGGDDQKSKDAGVNLQTDSRFLHYVEEASRQKQPYLEWVRHENNTGYDNAIEVDGWRMIKIPESDITILTYGKGILAASAFELIKSCFNKNKHCKIAYADEDYYWEDLSCRMQPWFKPCYSPDTLLSFNYWGHVVAAREELLSDVLSDGEIADGKEKTEQHILFYDLCLRLEEAVQKRCMLYGTPLQDNICHIDGVLFHRMYEPSLESSLDWKECTGSGERFQMVETSLVKELEAGRYLEGAGVECVPVREAALIRRKIKGALMIGPDPDIYHIVYDTSVSGVERCTRAINEDGNISPHHVVSVVIPSKDHPEVLERCLKSFREKTDYEYYEWIVVDNGSNAENRSRMEELKREYKFAYLYEEMPFNFSKMCNMGVSLASGDLILFMNDDVEVIEKSWLSRMVGQALQPHVGAVGAKLWYAGTQIIQHAGITNLKVGPSHKLCAFPDDRDYYYGRNRVAYDMIGVTAACMMVRREKYAEVGGLDETMAVSYNDVDFCFKLLEAGYYNVQRNDAVLYHHESLSRGSDEQSEDKWERLLAERNNLYAKHPQIGDQDIFYHRDLIDNAIPYLCNYKFPHSDRLLTLPVETMQKELTDTVNESRLKLTVDKVEIQNKIYSEEPDILWIMGWCYVPGADNAFYDKRVLLHRPGGGGYCVVPLDCYRPDVEKSLPLEKNLGLAGFVLRVLRKDLQPGTYSVGMLCSNGQGEKLLAWSDKTCDV